MVLWIELPEGWGGQRLVATAVAALGYRFAEVRDVGTGRAWLDMRRHPEARAV